MTTSLRPHHRTVDRVLAILGAVSSEPGGLTLSQLARTVSAPLSSVQSLAYGLVADGFLAETGSRYLLGPTAAVLAQRSGAPYLGAIEHAELVALHERTGAAALLVVRVGDEAVNADSVGLTDSAALADVTRWRSPLHVTAGGRVLLAHLPAPARRSWVAERLGESPEEAMALLDQLDGIRRDGVAQGPSGPLRPDLESVAVPLRRDGEVVAALALAQPYDGGRSTLTELRTALGELLAEGDR